MTVLNLRDFTTRKTPQTDALNLVNALIHLDKSEKLLEKTHRGFLVKIHKSLTKMVLDQEEEHVRAARASSLSLIDNLHQEYMNV